jgi:GT2 family glycosyltransferase
LALRAAPLQALAALRYLAIGKRVRAWNMLHSAAASHPDFYSRWIALVEPARQAEWTGARVAALQGTRRMVAVLIDRYQSGGSELSRRTIAETFGPHTPIVAAGANGPNGSELKQALGASDANWIVPLFAGDLLSPELADVLASTDAEGAAVYWDEDTIVAGRRSLPWAKPDWDPLLFDQFEGLLGASALRSDTVLELWDACVDERASGAALAEQFSSLCFAVACRGAQHVPLILTHRSEAPARRSELRDMDPVDWPSVSIIIPTRDLPDHLASCLNGLQLLDYPGEVGLMIIDNGSTDPAALELLAQYETRPGVQVLRRPGPFNFAQLNNDAVVLAGGELICFLNNDVEPLDDRWLCRLASKAMQPDVGAVGALLFYPDGSIQHAGVAIGIGGAAGHVQKGMTTNDMLGTPWYVASRRVSAVTAACMLVHRDKFLGVGGFDARAFPVAFNDVDLCLRLDAAGYCNLFIAEAGLIHHESKSRGEDNSPQKRARFAGELQQLQQRWQTQGYEDRWYSALFSRTSEQCLLRF